MMQDWTDRSVLVLGLGDTGLSMTRWLARHGARVSVADTREHPPQAATLARELPHVRIEHGFDDATVCAAGTLAISPGIDRRIPAVAAALRRGVPVVGDIELFAQAIASFDPRPKTLAVTGTNGKSTVTRMAGDICAAAGLATEVGGNIGSPVLDTLSEIENGRTMPDVFVLELSSFQLESTDTLDAAAATVLNVSEDHLDRHGAVADYAAAKARIFRGRGAQVLNRDDHASAAMALTGRAVQYFGQSTPRGEHEWGLAQRGDASWLARGDTFLMPATELPVAGAHNVANALAAGALCHALGIADAHVIAALRAFRGLPHRVEKIADIGGIAFFDDSKGTNVGATAAALGGFTRPVVLIAGGDGKGQNFAPLRDVVARCARAVVLLGRDRERIAAALEDSGVPLVRAADMEEAVAQAFALSRPGDAVLLSPACASFDMFRNYAHRGDVFAAAAKALEAAHG